jgi:LCP family protein required for cell wall assembly
MAQRGDSGARGGSGDDGYDWLYGGKGGKGSEGSEGSEGGSSGARDAGDEEATQVIPSMSGSRTGSTRSSSSSGRESAPPPSIAREPRRERSPRRSRRAGRGGPLRYLKWLLLAWLVFLVAVPVWAYVGVSKVDAEPAGDRPEDEGGTNYLVVGSDERPGLAGRRTDTIMLLHTGSGPNVLMSVPRDSIVEIPDRGTSKINSAFAAGGPRLLVRTFEQNTGIHVDDYVEIGFTGMVTLVDAVGGIEICPKEAIKDPLAKLDVDKGCQEADGDTALGYARTRKFSTGDIQRGQNQREVVSALGREILSWQTFVNPVRYYRTVTGGAESVRVSEGTGPFAIARFGVAMNRVDGEAGMTCTVPIADFEVNWDQERAEELFGFLQRNEAEDIPADLCTPTGRPE